MKMMEPVVIAIIETRRIKPWISRAIGVGPASTPEVSEAIRPMTVLSPTLMIIPRATPWDFGNQTWMKLPRRDVCTQGRKMSKETFDSVRWKEGQIFGLQRIVVSALGRSGLRLWFTSQRRVVHLEIAAREDENVGWQAVSEFHVDKVSHYQIFNFHRYLLSVSCSFSKLQII